MGTAVANYEERGLSAAEWRVLRDAIFPSAESDEAVCMAVDYCKARGLDIFKKPVHIVPIWDKKKGRLVETVWPGIAELRTTAARTGDYAGKDAPEWGPDKTQQFDSNVTVTFPEWCRVTVHKIVHGHRVGYTGEVYWIETYASKGKANTPNEMWRKRARGQLAKCAEAEALRAAFPEEIGGEHSAEEMEGQETLIDVTPPRPEPIQEEDEAGDAFDLINGIGEIVGCYSPGQWAEEYAAWRDKLKDRERAQFIENNADAFAVVLGKIDDPSILDEPKKKAPEWAEKLKAAIDGAMDTGELEDALAHYASDLGVAPKVTNDFFNDRAAKRRGALAQKPE